MREHARAKMRCLIQSNLYLNIVLVPLILLGRIFGSKLTIEWPSSYFGYETK